MSSLLELETIRLQYPGGSAPVLENFSLCMNRGELLCILGPSGCGKSTLLKSAAGLMPLSAGALRYAPSDRASRTSSYDRILVLQNEDQLFPWMTVLSNVGMPLRRTGHPDWQEKSRRILDSVQIPEAAGLYPHQLSGGMRQRAVMARAIAADPELLLLDEPFAHLDATVRGALQDLVVRIWQPGNRSVIFVTHDIQEALVLASRIVVLNRDGSILADQPLDLPRPRDPFGPELIGLVRDFRRLLA